MNFKHIFSQIQSWISNHPLIFLIVIAIGVRLIGINAPIIGVHAWRQADTAAIARNFYENGFNFLYPQIDWGGSGEGFCETEFPIYSFLVAMLYRVVGAQDFLGRLLSVACAIVGLCGLYQLTERFFERRAAFWACFFYALLPLLIYYTRTFQPESMLVMCSIWGVLYFKKWIDQGQTSALLISNLFVTIACLIKVLPLVYLGLPIAFLAWSRWGWKMFRMPQLWGYAVMPLVSVFLWYSHAHEIFLTYGNTFGFSGASTDRYDYRILLTWYFWSEILVKVAVRQFAIFGFFIFLVGCSLPKRNLQEWIFPVWLGASVLCWIAVPVTSVVHEYYHLNFMIPGVILMGKACAHYLNPKLYSVKSTQRRAIVTCISLALVASAAFYSIDYRSKENVDKSLVFELAQQVKSNTEPNAKIIATTGGDPSLLYLAHRKGWIINPMALTSQWIKEKQTQGARYLVGSFGFVESYVLSVDDNQKRAIEAAMQQGDRLQVRDNFIVKLRP